MDQKAKILDIAMNLNRIGNWAADDYFGKEKRIKLFLQQTDQYLKSLNTNSFSESFRRTYKKFLAEYQNLKKSGRPKNALLWAEKMMTWGNILTHRSKLI